MGQCRSNSFRNAVSSEKQVYFQKIGEKGLVLKNWIELFTASVVPQCENHGIVLTLVFHQKFCEIIKLQWNLISPKMFLMRVNFTVFHAVCWGQLLVSFFEQSVHKAFLNYNSYHSKENTQKFLWNCGKNEIKVIFFSEDSVFKNQTLSLKKGHS